MAWAAYTDAKGLLDEPGRLREWCAGHPGVRTYRVASHN
jgi:hypothetical protein